MKNILQMVIIGFFISSFPLFGIDFPEELPDPTTNQQEEKVDYAYFWNSLENDKKIWFCMGVRSALISPIKYFADLQFVAEESGDPTRIEIAKELDWPIELLNEFVFSDHSSIMSADEIALRIDLFYLDEENKNYHLFAAIYKAFLDKVE